MNERTLKRRLASVEPDVEPNSNVNSLILAMLQTKEGEKLLKDYAQVVELATKLVGEYKNVAAKLEALTERVAEVDLGYQNLVGFLTQSRIIRVEALFAFERQMKETMAQAEEMAGELDNLIDGKAEEVPDGSCGTCGKVVVMDDPLCEIEREHCGKCSGSCCSGGLVQIIDPGAKETYPREYDEYPD